ncbi:MAG: beta-ketoacyl synthase N-terminal-like domain-containing protein [Cyanobacteria bacterium P01_E01_bin.6]
MDKEPIAIVGIGCRFPGADGPKAFWQLLRDGVDAITPVPSDRWSESQTPIRWGGFLDQVDQFDPQFFGIATREVTRMDPQQRLLLEVAWEALEDAGLIPEQLAGTSTGVYVGISLHDYSTLVWRNPSDDPYATTGTVNCMAANRLSYLLDLRGPSLAIDTACSSSLVAVHLACQSLRSGESTLALAGGAQVMGLPEVTRSFDKAGFMAPDGRCKAFDSRADGYVRSEGAGVVVLKCLSQALADRDPIYALIQGSAINQDGRTNGLTAPQPKSQEALLRAAYRQAGISPGQVHYIEAHGTGTKLGDPIEMKALGAVLTDDRPAGSICAIGSVKTNIGHAEAAAGIAGLIKVALSLDHQQIPPSLHFQQPNPYIPFDTLPLQVQRTLSPWSGNPVAGVSSFGFGGTNAHVVLEAAPTPSVRDRADDRPSHLLTLSATSVSALHALAQRYIKFLTDYPAISLADVCFNANTKRSTFPHRLAAIATSTEALREQLQTFLAEQASPGLVTGQVTRRKSPPVVFLFTGQGSQYVRMGQELYHTQPIFREAIDQCHEILCADADLAPSLLEVLYPPTGTSPLLDQTAFTQPALFAVEYALAKLWQSWGIEPAAVMGHSIGEYVAACVAGVFSLKDGLRLVAARGRLMQALPKTGEMAAVLAPAAQVMAVLRPYTDTVSIAAYNGPENVVISGQQEAIADATATLAAGGIRIVRLSVSHAFHSPLMAPIRHDFEQVASKIAYSPQKIALISNVTGALGTADIATPTYWVNHLLQPVKFVEGMATLHQQGYPLFLEIGPKPTLIGMGQHCLPQGTGAWLSSLHPEQSDWQVMLSSLGHLFVHGVAIDWTGVYQADCYSRLRLPTYPFQRQRYWLETSPQKSLPPETGDLSPVTNANWSQQLAEVNPCDRLPLLVSFLQQEFARVLGVSSAESIEPTLGFFKMGFDSLMVVELKNRLEQVLGHSLSPTLGFNYPTIAALAGYLLRDVLQLEADRELEPSLPTAANESADLLNTDLLNTLEQLSEDETEVLLMEKLNALE